MEALADPLVEAARELEEIGERLHVESNRQITADCKSRLQHTSLFVASCGCGPGWSCIHTLPPARVSRATKPHIRKSSAHCFSWASQLSIARRDGDDEGTQRRNGHRHPRCPRE